MFGKLLRMSVAGSIVLLTGTSCQTWNQVGRTGPERSAANREGASGRGQETGPLSDARFKVIRLGFHQRTDRTPLTVAARQMISEVNQRQGRGQVSLTQKLRIVKQLGPVVPLSGLTVRLMPGASSTETAKRTDVRRIVRFYKGEDYEEISPASAVVQYLLLAQASSGMETRGAHTLRLPGGNWEEIFTEVYLDWDGIFLMRLDR